MLNFMNSYYGAIYLDVNHNSFKPYIKGAPVFKPIPPNEIQAGQKVYNYDREFYINIGFDELALIAHKMEKYLLTNDPQIFNGKGNAVSLWRNKGKSKYESKYVNTIFGVSSFQKQDGSWLVSFNINQKDASGNEDRWNYPIDTTMMYQFIQWAKFCMGTIAYKGSKKQYDDYIASRKQNGGGNNNWNNNNSNNNNGGNQFQNNNNGNNFGNNNNGNQFQNNNTGNNFGNNNNQFQQQNTQQQPQQNTQQQPLGGSNPATNNNAGAKGLI